MSNPKRPTQIPRRTGASSTRSQSREPTGNGTGGAIGTETGPGGPPATTTPQTRTARTPAVSQTAGTGGTTPVTGTTRTAATTGAVTTRTATGAGAPRTSAGAPPGLTRTVTTTAASGGPQNAGSTPAAPSGRRSPREESPVNSDLEDMYENPPELFEHARPGRAESISRRVREAPRREERPAPRGRTLSENERATAPRQGRDEPANQPSREQTGSQPDQTAGATTVESFEDVAREAFGRTFQELTDLRKK